jgi:hypothetical protein
MAATSVMAPRVWPGVGRIKKLVLFQLSVE